MQSREGFPRGWLLLYGVTAALELPVIVMRYAATLLVAAVLLRATGHPGGSASGWAELAAIPTLWSLTALANPIGGGWWWQQQMGGRKPSERERIAYEDAIKHLRAGSADPLPAPRMWFVVDLPFPDSAVCGDTLMLSRGLLESPYLPAVLAHELGHLKEIDGRLAAAVNRLVIQPPRRPWAALEERGPKPGPVVLYNRRIQNTILALTLARWLAQKAIVLLRGGLALRMMAPAWGMVWREQEYRADRYAASLGEAEDLAEFLELRALIDDRPIPLVWLTEHAHPPTELRVERLRAAQRPG